MHRTIIALLLGFGVPAAANAADQAQIQRGEYLVEMLACAACHTDGQLIDEPNAERYLAGSDVGIAYTNDEHPGVVFPANLTPDKQTGLGRWKPAEIRRNIQYGIDKHGHQQLPIMPWPGYAHLMSLPPIKHAVPKNVAPGTPSVAPYVRFGVYVFYPKGTEGTSHVE
jgi:hypothetical protein